MLDCFELVWCWCMIGFVAYFADLLALVCVFGVLPCWWFVLVII